MLCPYGDYFAQTISSMQDEYGQELEVANRPQTPIYIAMDHPVQPEAFLRKRREQ